jgi:hypothetical protein
MINLSIPLVVITEDIHIPATDISRTRSNSGITILLFFASIRQARHASGFLPRIFPAEGLS